MLYKRGETLAQNYDVIIIGSGLAGLTAANSLGKTGRRVLLLEAHNKLGGLATWFFRKDRTQVFDVSLHGFPVGMKKTCRKYWNMDIANNIVQLKNVRFVNPQFDLTTTFTREDFTDKLINFFKVPSSVVNAFFEDMFNMNFYDQDSRTNAELFEKYFPNRPDVVRFLMEPITYANGSTLEDPAITYGIVFSNFMSKGVFTFLGGTDHLIAQMRDELLKNNVDIKMQSLVEKVLVENGKCYGVVLEGQEILAKAVISNGNLLSTIFKMVGEEKLSSDYIHAAKKVRLNTSSCQVFMALKKNESFEEVGDLLFHSTANEFSTKLLLDKKVTSRTFSFYYPRTRPHEDPKYSIVSSTNAIYEDWSTLSEEQYAKDKDILAQDTLQCLEQIVPGIGEKMDHVEVATPLTVEWYTHHQKGSSFGTKFEGLAVSQNLSKEVQGLYHSGSVGIIMSGWLGAANYGVIVANEVDSYLFNQEKEVDKCPSSINTSL